MDERNKRSDGNELTIEGRRYKPSIREQRKPGNKKLLPGTVWEFDAPVEGMKK